jgi:hypothetical protein
MAVSTKAQWIIPEILTTAVRGAFAGKNAFIDSAAVAAGLVVVNDTFDVSDSSRIGDQISVPYFGQLGEFDDRTDGTPATPKALAGTNEKATIVMATLGVEITRWANNNGGTPGVTPEQEAAEQIRKAARRKMDRAVITAACASGALVKDVYSATVPRKLDADLIVDAGVLWGDENEDSAVLLCHSKAVNDLDKLKDAQGRPLGRDLAAAGRKIVTSDVMPLTGSTMSAITAAGTTPPTVTVSGTPTGPWNLKIICTKLGARGTSEIKFSTDGGQNYSAAIVTAASIPLIDTSVDAITGNNGTTGLTIAMADTAAAVDNVWTATATLKATSLLVRPGSLAFWFNRLALEFLPDSDPSNDSKLGWMHLYYCAHKYRRHPQGTKSGVIKLVHNVSPVT